ncbi:MAG: heterodisulfide reductase subunit F, partial [Bacteroidetes bacterium]|nr:heterodisulfide reductase subunit F [Bacteroidota bacterium]
LPPMRSVIWNCLDLRENYKDITILYGARTAEDLVYKNELAEWRKRSDVTLITTVDPGGETPEWKGEIGFVPVILDKLQLNSKDTIAIVCGPPVMINRTFPVLNKLGFRDENIFTTLENRMKCGFGKCGRCNIGKVFVCKDGPVFTLSQLRELPNEF